MGGVEVEELEGGEREGDEGRGKPRGGREV